jgi:hypothetical protein
MALQQEACVYQQPGGGRQGCVCTTFSSQSLVFSFSLITSAYWIGSLITNYRNIRRDKMGLKLIDYEALF